MINKLKIINGNTKKNVSFNFLIELYKICTGQNSDSPDYNNQYVLDNDSTISGQVSTQNIYEHIYIYLRNKFENFFIDYDNLVIYFKDRILDTLLCNKYGTNNTLTIQQAESVTSLMSFKNNTNITSFDELPYFKNVHILENDKFQGCTNLESIDLTYINTINPYVFQNCTKCHFKNINNILTLGECAFDGCKELTSIDLSNLSSSQSSIGNYTFRNCTNLESVTLSPYINKFNLSAFQNCDLKNINLSNITTLSNECLRGNNNLPDDLDLSNIEQCNTIINIKNIYMPNLKSCGQGSWSCEAASEKQNGNRIETINIPNAENLSNGWMFCGLLNLKEAYLNVKQGYNGKLGHYMFSGCSSLTTLNIGDNITEIGQNALTNTSIVNLNLNNVTTLGIGSLYNLNSLITVTAPNLTTLNNSALNRCTNLRRINSDVDYTYDLTNITSIGASVFSYDPVKNIILDPNLTILKEGVFYQCTSLETINVNNIITIETDVFKNCRNIATFTFDKLETIYYSFNGTDFEWMKITNENKVVTINNASSDTFKSFYNNRSHRIYVPDSLYNDYLADEGWITALSTNNATLKRLSEFTTDYGI